MTLPIQPSRSDTPVYRPPLRGDLLRFPIIGKLLRWRWGRLLFQLILLGVAMLIIYDGLTGRQLAPANSATVLAWVHYRGLILLALLLAGNVFCFGCPFTLPRTLARRISLAGPRWPRALRNKWVSVGSLFLIFWLYEWLDLWASPWLTAWLAIAYFISAFTLEALFAESPFCKYVCPLGAFNFTLSTLSPLQVKAVDLEVCRNCAGKECVRGSSKVLGCGTELYVPSMTSNMDCTMCLDCSRACPYNNVGLVIRRPMEELTFDPSPPRWDRSFLYVSLTFFGIMNAFGMVPPFDALLNGASDFFGIQAEAIGLLLLFSIGGLLLPALIMIGGSWFSRLTMGNDVSLKSIAARYAPAFLPLGFGVWLAHYGFHFAIGGLTIVPVLQSFFLDHGLAWLGTSPSWELGFLLPMAWIFPLQVAVVLLGFLGSLYVLGKKSLREGCEPIAAFKELLPWAVIILLLAIVSLSLFNLPMAMRGTRFIGT